MNIKKYTKLFVAFILISLSESSTNPKLLDRRLNNREFEGADLILSCVKSIIEINVVQHVLIVGKPEHFAKLHLAAISKDAAVKIYKRIRGWSRFGYMLETNWMTYILMFNRYCELEDYIHQFHLETFFNPRLHFIIIPLYTVEQKELEKFGTLLLKNNIINYLIIIQTPKQHSLILVSNFPYRHNSCGNFLATNDRVVANYSQKEGFNFLLERAVHEFFHYHKNDDLFPSKVPRNLRRCELKIVTGLWPPNVIDVNRRDYPGIEIEFIRAIAKRLNFVPKFTFISSNVGHKLPNGSWTGFMGYLKREEVDMAIGAVHIHRDRLFHFELTDWYLYNLMLWIVPRKKNPSKSAIFEHFVVDSSVYGKLLFSSAFLATLIAILIAARIVRTKDTMHYGQAGHVILVLIESFLAQSMDSTPRTVQVRRIFGLWLYFCTLTIFFFQTSITSFFMSPTRAHQLDNIQDALKENLRVSYDTYYDSFVKNASTEFDVAKLNEKFPVIPSLNLVAKGQAVTFIDRLRAIYITKQWLREDGSIPIILLYNNPAFRQIFNEETRKKFNIYHTEIDLVKIIFNINYDNYPNSYWVQVVMQKGHFLSIRINHLVRHFWTNGFWNFKEKEYIDRRMIQCSVRRQIILYNDINDLDNTQAVARYNDAIYEAFPKGDANEEVNRIFAPTAATEEELLSMFRVTQDSSINFNHLQAVFELYLIGVCMSIVAFISELMSIRIRSNFKGMLGRRKLNIQTHKSVAK